MKIKAVLMDFCGTLAVDVGASSNLPKAIANALNVRGFKVNEGDVVNALRSALDILPVGLDYSDVAKVALTLRKLDIDPTPSLVEYIYRVFDEALIASTKLEDDALDLLTWLRSHGIKTGILSNHGSYDAVTGFLKKHGILELFDIIVVSHHIGWKKPSKQIFNYALTLLRVNPENCVHVGDDVLADVFGAKKAGIKAIWKANQLSDVKPWIAPDAIITKLSQLKALIEQWR